MFTDLGKIKQYVDGVSDDVHVREAAVTATDQLVDHWHGSFLCHPLTAPRRQAGRHIYSVKHLVTNLIMLSVHLASEVGLRLVLVS